MISAIYANQASRMDQDDNNNDDNSDVVRERGCSTVISAAGCAICANQASNYSDLMKMKKKRNNFKMVMESLILKMASIHPLVENVQGKMLLYHFFAKD